MHLVRRGGREREIEEFQNVRKGGRKRELMGGREEGRERGREGGREGDNSYRGALRDIEGKSGPVRLDEELHGC